MRYTFVSAMGAYALGLAATACQPLREQLDRFHNEDFSDALVETCRPEEGDDLSLVGSAMPEWALVRDFEGAPRERGLDVRSGDWLEPAWTNLRDAALGAISDGRCCGRYVVYRQYQQHPEVVGRITYARGTVTRTRVTFVGDRGGSGNPRETVLACVGDGDLAIAGIDNDPSGGQTCSEEGRRVHAWLWRRDATGPEYRGHGRLSPRCPSRIEKITMVGRRLHIPFTSIRAEAGGRLCDELSFELE